VKLLRAAALTAALVMVTIAAAACGGHDDAGVDGDDATATVTRPASTATREATATQEAEDTPAPASSPTAAPTSAPPTSVPPTAAPSVDSLNVSAADFAFSPSALTVNGANDTNITLTNTGITPHSMKIYRDQAFTDAVPLAETQQIAGGASDDFTLTSVNVGVATQLFFRCEVHPAQMQGTIAVQ
jgi:plastocyanin